MRKLCWLLAAVLILVGAIGQSGVDVQGYAEQAVSWVSGQKAITEVVVIEESSERTPAQAAVLLGKTSNDLRAANKWGLHDKDRVPARIKADAEKAMQTNQVPFVMLYRGAKYTVKPLPATDAELAKLVGAVK